MIEGLSLASTFGLFLLAAIAIGVLGTKMTGLADRLADLTGLGEAITGAVLLGACTSLSGTVVSVTSALDGRASLAFANGVGGIAAQTAFLALADLVWRRGNLEHASADITNLFQAGLLALMLSLPLIAYAGPDVAIFGVHPVSPLLLVIYVGGLRATSAIREDPMWTPVRTRETRADTPDEAPDRGGVIRVAVAFAALTLCLGVAGWTVAKTGGRLADAFGVSETAVGALLTATVTSLPELVTTIAAVRRGAAQLAVGGIIGGNTFDMLFLTLSDAAYRDGSLYHAVTQHDFLWIGAGLAMTTTLLLGLIARERQGPGGIGVESVAMLAIYAVAALAQGVLG